MVKCQAVLNVSSVKGRDLRYKSVLIVEVFGTKSISSCHRFC